MREIIQFLPWHATVIGPRSPVARAEGTALFAAYVSQGPCYTLAIDARPVAAGGVVVVTPSTFETWMICCKDIERYQVSLYWAANKLINQMFDTYGVRRLQAVVDKNKVPYRKWAERLGFHVEGPSLLHFGPNGETYMRYVRFKDGGSDVHR